MIKSFDKNNLRTLREELQSAVLAVAAKHGITIVVGNASYFPEKASFKMEMITKGEPGMAPEMVTYKADFARYAKSFGLTPDQWGVQFVSNRTRYELVGLAPKRPKFPILAKNLDDQRVYKLTEASIRSLQSESYKKLYGYSDTLDDNGTCQNTNAFDLKGMKPKGQCTNKAVTSRKFMGKSVRYCADCAHLFDETKREAAAEARAS